MSYKTILVCLTNKINAEPLTKIACNIARQFNAHLVGIHTLPSLSVYPGISVPLSSDLEVSFKKEQLNEAEEIERIFQEHAGQEDFVSEWRSVETQSHSAADVIVEHARCADLVIMPQPDYAHDRGDQHTIQRNVIEQSGRPVLVIPSYGTFESVGENVLVGWSATKEATRAVHDAIPFMRDAKTANIFWVSKTASDETYLAHSAREIATTLDRNGVKANVERRVEHDISIGDELLNEASDTGADMIVAGAYGHSRVYDFMVGATTPHLMKHMTVPVLFSC